MFSVFVFLTVVALSFGPLAAFCYFDSISFSPVQQCGNFSVLFSGGKPPASLPLTLTIVPFNATPVAIEIPNSDWNASTVTGAAITFLPFPAGTNFLASLDDAEGVGTGSVSDVIDIDASHKTSCLAGLQPATPPRYTINGTLSQCQPFDILWDASIIASPPTIRAFVPNNLSTFVNQDSSSTQAAGRATYILNVFAGQEVALMFSDDTGHRESTGLVLVQGDIGSSMSCLQPQWPMASPVVMQTYNTQDNSSKHSALSRSAVIAISVVSSCVVGAIAIAMGIWLYRERRQLAGSSQTRLESGGDDALSRGDQAAAKARIVLQLRKPSDVPKVIVRSASFGVNRNPPYTDVKFELVTPSYARRISEPQAGARALDPPTTGDEPLSSIPVPLTTPLPLPSDAVEPRQRVSALQIRTSGLRGGSMSSADIAQILDMATIYSGPTTPQGRPPSSPPKQDTPRSRINTSSPVLLTPHSGETYRDPPQAPLPSSPLPSPSVAPSFRIGSIASVEDREARNRGLSGFAFFKVERASASDSFLNM